jgi:hypothetical protein
MNNPPTLPQPPGPLLKEVARPGVFTDWTGASVTLTADTLRKAVDHTTRLQDKGFKVRAFTSHGTDDSKDVLGTWGTFHVAEDGRVYGVLHPISEAARALALSLDTSVVLEEDVDGNDGDIFPLALTRVDVVPQGAIIGTAPFKALSRRYLFQRGAPAPAPNPSKERKAPMSSKLMQSLAKAMGLPDSSAPEVLEHKLLEVLDVLGAAEDAQVDAMAAAMGKMLMPEPPPAPAPAVQAMDPAVDPADLEDAAEMMAEDPEALKEAPPAVRAALSTLTKQVARLQDDKLSGLFPADFPAPDQQRIMAQFSKVRAKAGFELAFDVARDQVALSVRAATPAAPAAPPATRLAARPSYHKTDPAKRKEAVAMLARAAESMGMKRKQD